MAYLVLVEVLFYSYLKFQTKLWDCKLIGRGGKYFAQYLSLLILPSIHNSSHKAVLLINCWPAGPGAWKYYLRCCQFVHPDSGLCLNSVTAPQMEPPCLMQRNSRAASQEPVQPLFRQGCLGTGSACSFPSSHSIKLRAGNPYGLQQCTKDMCWLVSMICPKSDQRKRKI